MPEIPYLVDSNILIRWIQPHDSDYPGIETALTVLTGSGGVLCYTSQNVAEAVHPEKVAGR